MANWTYITIEFHGAPDDIDDLFSSIASKDNRIISFDRIIPAPKCIKKTRLSPSGSRLANEVERFYEKAIKNKKDPIALIRKNKLSKDLKKEIDEWNKSKEYYLNLKTDKASDLLEKKRYKRDVMEVVENYITCLKETGHIDWYGWNVDNWGCKWDASDTSRDGNDLSFCTPYGAPFPIFYALAKKFKDIWFRVYIDYEFGTGTDIYEYEYDEDEENNVMETFVGQEEYENIDEDDEDEGDEMD